MFTTEQVEKMSKDQLKTTAKSLGIKYGKLSLMQIRESIYRTIIAHKDDKPTSKVKEKKERKERTGTKMLKAIELFESNPNATRKQMIALFREKAKLTPAGSNTYYALIVKKMKK